MGKIGPFVGIGDEIGLVVGIGPVVEIGLFGGTGLVVSPTSMSWFQHTLKQELDGTCAYQETDADEMSVVNAHLNELPLKFSICVNEGQDKLPTMYWLPKLHKRPYKARFIANSSSCTTTELF